MTSLNSGIVTDAETLEAIHRLNYRTFVEEIPQHAANPRHRLVDKFHTQNTYIACHKGPRLAGFLAIRAERPFSLDGKLNDLDAYLPQGYAPCEIRLLCVEHEYRHTTVFLKLFQAAARYCQRQKYGVVLMSGTLRQQRLYRHLGFTAFGPKVGTRAARYQPMYVLADEVITHFGRLLGGAAHD